jgi:hypothetical protein
VALRVSGVLLGVAACATSQAQDAKTSDGAVMIHNDAQSVRRNLKVLSARISDSDLILLMVRYGQELGVQCGFCHVENQQTQEIDFASDENPMKQTARVMIGMLVDINTKYLAKIGDRRYAVPITCGNCHQGQTFPPTFQPGS